MPSNEKVQTEWSSFGLRDLMTPRHLRTLRLRLIQRFGGIDKAFIRRGGRRSTL